MAGTFWNYFKNTLRYPQIWKKGALAQLAKGGASALDVARDNIRWLRNQFLPEMCEDDFIARFASSRGLRHWPVETESFFKQRVIQAYLFYKQGGRPGGLRYFFDLAGIEGDIVEPTDSYDVWLGSGGKTLDGTWNLDGSVQLKDFENAVGIPYLDWAEFAVQANLASAGNSDWKKLAQMIVAEFKPARSVAKWFYTMDLDLDVDKDIDSGGALNHHDFLNAMHACNPLDGSWNLGSDEKEMLLDGTLVLDGSWQVGQIISAQPERWLKNCRIQSEADLNIAFEIPAGEPDLTQLPYFFLGGEPFFSLSKTIKKVDGTWDAGADNRLDGSWQLDGTKYLSAPRLGETSEHTLDGTLKVGYDAPQLNGDNKIGWQPPECESWPGVR